MIISLIILAVLILMSPPQDAVWWTLIFLCGVIGESLRRVTPSQIP
jgi:hypothetical protein